MASYTFNKSIILSGQLIPDQLQSNINLDENISPICTSIDTTELQLTCWFDAVLDVLEQVELENIIINFVEVDIPKIISANVFVQLDKLDTLVKYTKSNIPISNLTWSEVGGTGWTKVVGNLTGFDTSTGRFICDAVGKYFYNLIFTSSSFGANNSLSIEIRDSSNSVIVPSTKFLSSVPDVWGDFIGNGGILFNSNELRFYFKSDVEIMNIDVEFKISREMS
jgi:hypothetical protein